MTPDGHCKAFLRSEWPQKQHPWVGCGALALHSSLLSGQRVTPRVCGMTIGMARGTVQFRKANSMCFYGHLWGSGGLKSMHSDGCLVSFCFTFAFWCMPLLPLQLLNKFYKTQRQQNNDVDRQKPGRSWEPSALPFFLGVCLPTCTFILVLMVWEVCMWFILRR